VKEQCSVPGCDREAVVEVLLYDLYPDGMGRIYHLVCARDYTCPFLCFTHLQENEARCQRCVSVETGTAVSALEELLTGRPPDQGMLELAGRERTYRRVHAYPFTNQRGAQGFSVYRPLEGNSR